MNTNALWKIWKTSKIECPIAQVGSYSQTSAENRSSWPFTAQENLLFEESETRNCRLSVYMYNCPFWYQLVCGSDIGQLMVQFSMTYPSAGVFWTCTSVERWLGKHAECEWLKVKAITMWTLTAVIIIINVWSRLLMSYKISPNM